MLCPPRRHAGGPSRASPPENPSTILRRRRLGDDKPYSIAYLTGGGFRAMLAAVGALSTAGRIPADDIGRGLARPGGCPAHRAAWCTAPEICTIIPAPQITAAGAAALAIPALDTSSATGNGRCSTTSPAAGASMVLHNDLIGRACRSASPATTQRVSGLALFAVGSLVQLLAAVGWVRLWRRLRAPASAIPNSPGRVRTTRTWPRRSANWLIYGPAASAVAVGLSGFAAPRCAGDRGGGAGTPVPGLVPGTSARRYAASVPHKYRRGWSGVGFGAPGSHYASWMSGRGSAGGGGGN